MLAGVTPDRQERRPPSTGSRPSRPSRPSRRPIIAWCLLGVGLLLCCLAARDVLVWHDAQRDAARDLRSVEDVRRVDGRSAALDAEADRAIERLTDDALVMVGAVLFALGGVLVGGATAMLLGRAGRRQARIALHPSLVAAADRKLERLLAEHAQDLVTMLDDHGRFTYVSPSVSAILGYAPAALLGKRFDAYLDAPTLDAVDGDRRAGDPLRHRARHANGDVRWLETLSHRIDDERTVGQVTLYSSRDVTERVRLEETLAAERRVLGDTLANIHAGILSVDVDGRVVDANAELCSMIGFRPEPGTAAVTIELRYDMVDGDGDGVPVEQRPLLRALRGESVKQLPATLVAADGARREVMATAGPLLGSDGHHNGAVLTLNDVSELRAAEAELRSLATVDMLTGLPNRRHLVATLTDAMERNVETPERIALLFLDLDGFKDVNDSYGHDVGDAVLRLVGERIVTCLRGNDVVARMGGDEFVVVVEHLAAPSDIVALVERIERTLSEPFEVEVTTLGAGRDAPMSTAVMIGASVGVALGSDVTGAADLLARADAAMYERKRTRRASTAGTDAPVAAGWVSGPG